MLEGITYAMNDSLGILRELGLEVEEIRATGGGAKSAFWRQLQADVYGAPVITVNATEGPAFGAALMAGVGAGMFADLATATDALVQATTTAEPIQSNVETYREYYGAFRELYPALKENFSSVSEIVRRRAKEAKRAQTA